MKQLILSIQLTLVTLIGYSQPSNSDNLTTPKMEFKTELIDYGTIDQGSDGVREFYFTNTGNSPVIISEGRKTCGCTIPSIPKEPIKPGKAGVIKVKYDTNRLGTFNKSVIIISNAERSEVTLKIKGTVIQQQTTPIKDNTEKPVAH